MVHTTERSHAHATTFYFIRSITTNHLLNVIRNERDRKQNTRENQREWLYQFCHQKNEQQKKDEKSENLMRHSVSLATQ